MPVINGHSRWLLSGGIGSGKTAVGEALKHYGWHVVDSDSIGHLVLQRDGPAFRDVATRWPDAVVGGHVDRAALGRIVFAAPEQLDELERMTHPHIFGMIQAGIEGISGPIAVEIPLLKIPFAGEWKRMVVDSLDEVRLSRLLRRGMSVDSARARIRSQPSRSTWLAAADLVVPNHKDLEELNSTVSRLVPKL